MQVYTVAGNDSGGIVDAIGEEAHFNYPVGVAVDKDNNVFVTDNHLIRKIAGDTKVTTVAGTVVVTQGEIIDTVTTKFGCKQGRGDEARFYDPSDLDFDSAGNVIIADRINNCIRKLGATQYFTVNLDNPAENIAKLGIEMKENELEMVFVIEEIPFQGLLDKWNAIHQSRPVCVGDCIWAVNGISEDMINMKEELNVKKLEIGIKRPGTVSILAGSTVGALVDGKALDARFFHPAGVAVDKEDNIFVADKSNNCIRKIVTCPDTKEVTVETFAGDNEEGCAGWVDRKGSDARFNHPCALAVDDDGNIIVADQLNHCIRLIDPEGEVKTIAGTGRAEFNDASSKRACFNTPSGIAVDANGNVIVADRLNHRIRKMVKETEDKWRVSTIAGNGETDFQDGKAEPVNKEGKAGVTSFFQPLGVATLKDGNIVVTDSCNRRLRVVAMVDEKGAEYPLCPLVEKSKVITTERLERIEAEKEAERQRIAEEKKAAREAKKKETIEKQARERAAKEAARLAKEKGETEGAGEAPAEGAGEAPAQAQDAAAGGQTESKETGGGAGEAPAQAQDAAAGSRTGSKETGGQTESKEQDAAAGEEGATDEAKAEADAEEGTTDKAEETAPAET